MKNTIITLFFITCYSTVQCCSFIVSPFCNSVNEENTTNVILRGYFSDSFSNGLTFTRIETLRGDEERDQIKIWDNTTLDCNGPHERKASQMGALNQEIIISLAKVDSIIFGNEILVEDYRVPEGLWWQTHSLVVNGDSITGFSFQSQQGEPNIESIHFDDFMDQIINSNECTSTSTVNTKQHIFQVFPSLVNDHISIQSNINHENSKLIVYRMNGNLVFSEPLKASIYLGMLEQGMYLVVVQTENNECYHQKIIKI